MCEDDQVSEETTDENSSKSSPLVKIDSLVKVNGKFGSKLWESVKNFFGYFKPVGSAINAKAEVSDLLTRGKAIKKIKELLYCDDDTAQQLALSSNQYEILKNARQFKNRIDIVKKAMTIDVLPEDVTDEPVDEDWMSEFFEYCKNMSNENMKVLWARILAEEVSKPGSLSKRAIDFCRTISTKEAETFTKFCHLVWKRKDSMFYVYCSSGDVDRIEEFDITYEEILMLDSIGLITYSVGSVYDFHFNGNETVECNKTIKYYDNEYLIERNATYKGGDWHVPCLRLTPIGMELFKICGSEKNLSYLKKAIKMFETEGLLLTLIEDND